MITVISNFLTDKKHTLNLIDHNGKIIGFNPYPDGHNPIKYNIRSSIGVEILNEKTMPIEKYLIGLKFHFGECVSFVSSEYDDLVAMDIELVNDNCENYDSKFQQLHIEGCDAEYYIEGRNVNTLSEEDKNKLFDIERIEQIKEKYKKNNPFIEKLT